MVPSKSKGPNWVINNWCPGDFRCDRSGFSGRSPCPPIVNVQFLQDSLEAIQVLGLTGMDDVQVERVNGGAEEDRCHTPDPNEIHPALGQSLQDDSEIRGGGCHGGYSRLPE